MSFLLPLSLVQCQVTLLSLQVALCSLYHGSLSFRGQVGVLKVFIKCNILTLYKSRKLFSRILHKVFFLGNPLAHLISSFGSLSPIIYIYIYIYDWVQVTPSVTLSNVIPPNNLLQNSCFENLTVELHVLYVLNIHVNWSYLPFDP